MLKKYSIGFHVREVMVTKAEASLICEPTDGWLLKGGSASYAALLEICGTSSKSHIPGKLIPLKRNLEKSGEETHLFLLKIKCKNKFFTLLSSQWATVTLEISEKKSGEISIWGGADSKLDFGTYDIDNLWLK